MNMNAVHAKIDLKSCRRLAKAMKLYIALHVMQTNPLNCFPHSVRLDQQEPVLRLQDIPALDIAEALAKRGSLPFMVLVSRTIVIPYPRGHDNSPLLPEWVVR
jgi:hypothetical protein